MEQILHIIHEMSPYLLLGFLLAGLMHAFVPSQMYSRYLSKPTFRSVFNAALFGIPLPLCSCGVIPTAMSLRREGASKGAAVSFLIATPQTGVDSIIATSSLMGLPFAIIRPIAALVTALFGGQMVNKFAPDDKAIEQSEHHHDHDCQEHNHHEHHHQEECCCHDHDNHDKECGCGHHHHHDHAVHAECGCGCEHHHDQATTVGGKLKEALEYGFVHMMADIGKWLVVGLVVAALITVLVPDSFFEVFADNSFLSMLLVLCMAIPMYLCATGSIPIAVALMMKGLTPGAGLVLLMAGPASNVASILVIRKVLGSRTQIVYLASIILGAILFGLGIDYLLPREWFTAQLVSTIDCHEEGPSWFSWLCTGVLILLLLNALLLQTYLAKCKAKCAAETAPVATIADTVMDNENQIDALMQTVKFHIKGMNCNHCRMNAEKALLSVAGVVAATVTLETEEAIVTGSAPIEALHKAVEEIGFTAQA